MQHPVADFLGSSLVPELSSYISAGTPCHIHFALVGVSAARAAPDKLSAFFGDIVTEGGGKTAGGAGKDTRPASGYDGLRFEDIEYSRPDMAEFDRCLTRCCQTARTSDDISEVEDAVWEYYYAHTARKIAPALEALGRADAARDLRERADIIYEGT